MEPRACFAPDFACKLSPEIVSSGEIVGDVSDVGHCAQLCNNRSSCEFYTFYSGEAAVVVGGEAGECHLLSSCPHLVEVEGAVTASQRSDCTCSLEVVPGDGHLLASLSAPSEVECLLECRAERGCTHYLYHQSLAYCKLLESPTTFLPSSSPDLRTGPTACKYETNPDNVGGVGKDICRLAVLNNSSHLLVDYVVSDMEILVNSAINDCYVDLELVAVGPGGSYEMLAGGGSGRVSNTSLSVLAGTLVRLQSQQTGSRFTFSVSLNGSEVLSSTPGDDGCGYGNNTGGGAEVRLR